MTHQKHLPFFPWEFIKKPWPRCIDFYMINPWKIILIVVIPSHDGFKEMMLSQIITAASTPLSQLLAKIWVIRIISHLLLSQLNLRNLWLGNLQAVMILFHARGQSEKMVSNAKGDLGWIVGDDRSRRLRRFLFLSMSLYVLQWNQLV